METNSIYPKYLFVGVIMVTLSLIAMMGYLIYSGDRLAARQSPLVDAAMEIKLELSLGHLRLEEILSGDLTENIDHVWSHIDQADWYARAMLEGGKNAEGSFSPLTDHSMRSSMQFVRLALKEFRSIAAQRLQNTGVSLPGSELDQKFDDVFSQILLSADQVETLLQQKISEELRRFHNLSILLFVFALVIAALVSYLIFRLEHQRERHVSTIEKAHEKIQLQHDELRYLAYHDHLTDLPNRTLFLDRLEQELSHAQRKQSLLVLLFVDLDNFKSVNDHLGHDAGNQVLRYTAERLRKSVRADDTVARLGGDEFTVILADIASKEHALDTANAVAGNISKELSLPFGVEGSTAFITASIGIAVFPQDGSTVEVLLRNADGAMFEAKQRGKNNYQFHSEELNNRAQRRLRIENELRHALDSDQFILHYQPQWDIQDKSLVGFEVLLRWNHPERGTILPGEFIPVAETRGLIDRIDTWVLETACAQYRQWHERGLRPGRMAINISPMLFRRPDLVRTISGIIAESYLDTVNLELEITESALMEDTEQTRKVLQQLKNQGIRLAIDDFGTGYSSMAYLREFPTQTLKIDRSFIHAIHQDKAADAILTNMVELAKNLDMEVVAEGIETKAQAEFVRSLGCRYAQGFSLANPMSAKRFRLLMLSESTGHLS